MIRDFVSLLKKVTYLPDHVILTGALTLLSASINRKLYVAFSMRRYYPNLFVLFAAPSRSGKNVIINDTIIRMAREAFPELVLPRKWTTEKLYALLAERNPSTGIVYNEEFGMYLMNAKKSYMSDVISPFVELYDSPDHDVRSLMSATYTLHNVYIVAVLGTQPSTMESAIKSTIFDTGFLPKFLTVGFERPQRRPVDPLDDHLDEYQHIVETLRNIYLYFLNEPAPRPIRLEDSAMDVFYRFADYIDSYGTNYLGTLPEYFLKIAAIKAIDDDPGSPIVTRTDAIFAEAYIKSLLKKMLTLYSSWSGNKDEMMMARILEWTDGQWVPRSILLKKLNVRARYFDDLVETLIQRDELEYRTLPTGGRPVTFYRRKF